MSKPTKTINRIHFSDLDPIRFEDLSMQLVYRLTNWESLNHDGRSGSDNGVDIRGIEKIDEGERKFWAIQCKRYKKITSTELKKIVNEAIKKSNNPPNVLLIILACDVSQKLRETFENYSREMGIDEAIIWQASNLESKLYSDHPDLLFAFFGISINQKYNVKEQQIKKNLAVKRKLNKILQEYYVGNKIIIHSADDTTYPNCIETPQGKISPWFGLEYYGTYATGIEFRLTVYSIILERNPKDFKEAKWSIFDASNEGLEPKFTTDKDNNTKMEYDYSKIIDLKKYGVYKVYALARISYGTIFEIDDIGDGIYPGLHLYCRFNINNMPYEEFLYQIIDDHFYLDNKSQFDFKDR